ncbi:MAG: glycosyltransferase family 4 protein [candidate division NC10 bacterium]|nr:glycosyltransferase family 4 protein [candidate division NC10 bacterium]MBI4840474.1 glycosyltransferase family 4 protein [candidate division NC10 bacterium]
MAVLGRPIRIARVITRLNVGGPAQHAILLTAGLDRTRFLTTLITGVVGRDEGDLSPAARDRGIQPIVVPELGRAVHPVRDILTLARLVWIFRHVRPDIVHTHMSKAGTLGRMAARLAGVPRTLHTFHGHVLEGYFSSMASHLFLWIERVLARRTDRIIALSPRLREAILAMGIGRTEQVEVVPLGLDLDRFRHPPQNRDDLRTALRIPPGTPLLGVVGRLVPIKDHLTLFHALAHLEAGSPAPHVVVIGDGERRAELQRSAQRLNLAPRIHFLGWRNDLETILSQLDVVICCSRNEGTPVALIEAMAAGVPVLSTDVGGVSDLIVHGETGWLVPAGDPPALARAIEVLLADPALRHRLAVAARPVALERHDVKGLIRRMEALYEGLLAAKQLEISN